MSKNKVNLQKATSTIISSLELDTHRAWVNTHTHKDPIWVSCPLEDVKTALAEQLCLMKQEINYLTYKHAHEDIKKGNGQANAKSRDLFRDDEIYVPDSWAQPYRIKEIARTQAYESLSTNHMRARIAAAFEYLGWDASYKQVKQCLEDASGKPVHLKRSLYENIQRSRIVSPTPYIKHPKLMLSAVNNQLATMSVDWNRRCISLVVYIQDKEYKIEYVIPSRVLAKKDKIIKISRPSLHFDDDGVMHSIFAVKESIIVPPKVKGSCLCFDLGKCDDNPFVAARVYSDGRCSEALLPSAGTMKVWSKIRVLDEELSCCKAKRARLFWENHIEERVPLDDNIEQLLAKITRLKKHLSWLIAGDLSHLALAGETVVSEDLSWLVGSGKWSFGDILDAVGHVCARDGRDFALVSATNNSKTCPVCGERIVPSPSRLSSCGCGWSANRDLSACAVMGRKFFGFLRGQARLVRAARGVPARERARSGVRGCRERSSASLTVAGVCCGAHSNRAGVRGACRVCLSFRWLCCFLDWFLECLVAEGVSLVPKPVMAERLCGNQVGDASLVSFDNKIGHGYNNSHYTSLRSITLSL